jgi:hypothetical protein
MRKYDVALSAVESFHSIEMADGPNCVAFFEETMRATPFYGVRITATSINPARGPSRTAGEPFEWEAVV